MGNDESMLAFRNADGSTVIFVANKRHHDREMTIAFQGKVLHVRLQPKSFNTFILS
jgi:glucosylceramidase